VPCITPRNVCVGPKTDDDRLPATALIGIADYIVSRDVDLLTLGSDQCIPILDAAPALHAIRADLETDPEES